MDRNSDIIKEELYLQQLAETRLDNNWVRISSMLKFFGYNKKPKECRDRWINYLNPILDRTPFEPEEVHKLFSLYHQMGPSWVKMSKLFENRSENMLKNNFNFFIRIVLNEFKEKISGNKEFKSTRMNTNLLINLSIFFNVPIDKVTSLSLDTLLIYVRFNKRPDLQKKVDQSSFPLPANKGETPMEANPNLENHENLENQENLENLDLDIDLNLDPNPDLDPNPNPDLNPNLKIKLQPAYQVIRKNCKNCKKCKNCIICKNCKNVNSTKLAFEKWEVIIE